MKPLGDVKRQVARHAIKGGLVKEECKQVAGNQVRGRDVVALTMFAILGMSSKGGVWLMSAAWIGNKPGENCDQRKEHRTINVNRPQVINGHLGTLGQQLT